MDMAYCGYGIIHPLNLEHTIIILVHFSRVKNEGASVKIEWLPSILVSRFVVPKYEKSLIQWLGKLSVYKILLHSISHEREQSMLVQNIAIINPKYAFRFSCYKDRASILNYKRSRSPNNYRPSRKLFHMEHSKRLPR